MKLNPSHLQEWLNSGVTESIVALNVHSIEGDSIYSHLCYSPDLDRLNSGRLAVHLLNRYRFPDGGWWVSGVDPISGEALSWGQFKANHPRFNEHGKPIKYEAPPKTQAEIYCLRVSYRDGLRVAKKANLEESYRKRLNPLLKLDNEDKGFWQWVIESGCAIVITEGAKKAGALLSQGYAAIALPGIFMGQRVAGRWYGQTTKRELHRLLKPFATFGRRVTFIFDNDLKPSTRKAVRTATILTGKLFEEKGCKVFSGGWYGLAKGVDDFIMSGGDIHLVMTYAKTLKQFQADKVFELTYKPALKLHQRYLGNLPFPQSGLAAIKSPKGSGKTYSLGVLAKICESTGRKILLLTHRIALGKSICEAIALPWISDRSESAQEFKQFFGHGQCVDSLREACTARFNPYLWEGAIVIIDEVEQVLWHLLNSATCQKDRVEILENFRKLIQVVLSTGGLVIAQDADLSDWSLNFIRAQVDFDIQPWLVTNDYKATDSTYDVTFFNTQSDPGITKDDPSELLRQAAEEVKAGGRVFIALDAQGEQAKWGTTNVEVYMRRLCPKERIIRIDQKTLGNPSHPAHGCEETINELLKDYDIVICSPSLGTGVSVNLRGHFTGVYGAFQGSITADEARQALGRVRECVPRFVWARKYAVGRIGNGETSAKELRDSKNREIRRNFELISRGDTDFDSSHDVIAFKYWALRAARINSESFQYRDAVLEGLHSEGHRIIISGDSDETTAETMKAICEESWEEVRVAVASATPIDANEYQNLQNKQTRTDEERYSERRYEIEQRYLVEASQELVKLDDQKIHPQLRLAYLLAHDPEGKIAKHRDNQTLDRHLKNGGGQFCPQDLWMISARLKAVQRLDVMRFCNGRRYSNESPEVQDFFEMCIAMRKDILRYCGVKITPKTSPMRFIQSLLNLLGYRLIGEQRRIDGKAQRFYHFDPVESRIEVKEFAHLTNLREQIFERWLERDLKSIEAAEAENCITTIQNCHTSDIEDLNNQQVLHEADDANWFAETYLPILARESDETARDDLKGFINALGDSWRDIFRRASREVQLRLGALIDPQWLAAAV